MSNSRRQCRWRWSVKRVIIEEEWWVSAQVLASMVDQRGSLRLRKALLVGVCPTGLINSITEIAIAMWRFKILLLQKMVVIPERMKMLRPSFPIRKIRRVLVSSGLEPQDRQTVTGRMHQPSRVRLVAGMRD